MSDALVKGTYIGDGLCFNQQRAVIHSREGGNPQVKMDSCLGRAGPHEDGGMTKQGRIEDYAPYIIHENK
jgi:hypothetical protein